MIKSVPSIRSRFKGDLSIKDGKVNVGLTLANKPNFCLIFNNPCSGLTFAEGSLSKRGCPMAPKRTASALAQTSWVSSGYGSPTASMAAAPVNAGVQLIS